MTSTALIFLYVALLWIGGLAGYLFSGSLVSLIASVGSGLLLVSFLYTSHTCVKKNGILLTLLGLALFFGFRTWKSGSFIPAGILCIITLIALALFYKSCTCKSVQLDDFRDS